MNFKCTFTGVDEKTSFEELRRLCIEYPFIEFGILFSYSKAGLEPRYPSLDFIKYFAAWFNAINNTADYKGSIALHVCGQAVRELLHIEVQNMMYPSSEPYGHPHIDMMNLIPDFDRVQLNINLKEFDVDWVKAGIGWKLQHLGKEYNRPFILQYNDNNATMLDFILKSPNQYIHILKDASGGNGIEINDYSIPQSCSHTAIGFAGGIGVDNVKDVLFKVHDSVMSQNVEGTNENKLFWIDMENKIRTADHFDLNKVRDVARIVNEQWRTW